MKIAGSAPRSPGARGTEGFKLPLNGFAHHLRTDLLEAVFDVEVAPADLVDIADGGDIRAGQAGQQDARSRADIVRLGVSPPKSGGPVDDGQAVLFDQVDVGAQFAQFGHLAEAFVENAFADIALAVGNARQGHDGRLKVRREPGVGAGQHVDRLQPLARRRDIHDMPVDPDLHAHLHDLLRQQTQILGNRPNDGDLASGDTGGHHEQAGIQAVVHGVVVGGRKGADPLHGQGAGAQAVDLAAHADQKLGEIIDFRVGAGVFDDRHPFGKTGRHHEVFRAGMAGKVEIQVRAGKIFTTDDKGVAAGDGGPQAGEAAVVVVEVAAAQRTAAHAGQADLAQAFEQGRDEEHRRAQPASQGFGQVRAGEVGGIHADHFFIGKIVHPGAHVTHDLKGHENIVERRYVADNAASIFGEQGGGQHGQDGVLGTLHAHAAVQWAASLDFDNFLNGHDISFFSDSPWSRCAAAGRLWVKVINALTRHK
ncbi:hypothetical protein DESC_200021 [Desulfosarcina cetonica]|nr:hypothetical protein DESC_200021 [Desulfosarcina cetonica]